MIDPSMDTLVAPSFTELHEEIKMLKRQLEYAVGAKNVLSDQITNFEQHLKDNPWGIDDFALAELADIFDIHLTKEYDVEITVRFTGQIQVPHDFDMNDLDQYITASMDFYGDMDISNDYLEESDISVDWSEN